MSNTLKFGTDGNWATKEGSTLAYNDENGNFKPLPFNFTRSTSATRVNKEGLIEVVSNNEPRIDFTNDSKGALLLEPSRSNLVTYSEDFSNAYWGTSRIETPYIADVVSPDGTLNAFTLEMSSGETNGGGVFRAGISISGDNSFSVFAKKKTANYLALGDTGLTSNAVYFDLENGVVGTTYNATGEMEYFGNGWYRCTMKYTITSDLAKFIYLSNIDGVTSGGVVGGDSIYIWGAQLEQGSYATSYIPTQGSIGTRVAESCNGAGNEQVFNDSEGVLYVEISSLTETETFRDIRINDGSSNNRVAIRYSTTTNEIEAYVVSNGTETFKGEHIPQSIVNFNKIAIKYKNNDFSLWVNGLEVVANTGKNGGGTPVSLNNINFSTSLFNFYGNTKQLQYFDKALSDSELVALTT